jgi:hypothetical protein
MSFVQQCIIGVFGVITLFFVVSGFIWVFFILKERSGPRSLGELRCAANASKYWFLIPFSDKARRIWQYSSWIVGAAWLIAGYIARNS